MSDLLSARAVTRAAARGGVRRAGARDLDRVAALWSALSAHHAALDPAFAQRADADAQVVALLGSQLRDADTAIFVWECGGDLAGFCSARIGRAPAILVEAERAEITDLGVRPGQRRGGIGRALASAALAWVASRGVGRIEVRVATANAEGQAFWRALGFDDLMDVLQRRL